MAGLQIAGDAGTDGDSAADRNLPLQEERRHLIRVTGPSFDLVSAGPPRAFRSRSRTRASIDISNAITGKAAAAARPDRLLRCRRPRRVRRVAPGRRRGARAGARSHCDDEDGEDAGGRARGPSLPAHLERVVLRLTAARASGKLGDAFDDIIDRVSRDWTALAPNARGARRRPSGADREACRARRGTDARQRGVVR